MTKKTEITISNQRYFLPQGFYLIENRVGFQIYDEIGRACTLYYVGYTSKVDDNQPWVMTRDQKRLPLEKNNQFGLSDELYNRFKKLQEKHFNAWESNNRREQHSIDNIERVKYNPSEDLFYVYYKETEHFDKVWYHYDTHEGVWW